MGELKAIGRVCLLILLQAVLAAPSLAARLPLRRYTTDDGLPHNRVNQIMQDSHGFLWFCTPNGLGQFDGTTFVTHGADQALSRGILEDTRGFYWVVSGGAGIYRLDPQTDDPDGVLTRYIAPDNANVTGIIKVLRDRSGTLWACGERGLFILEERGARGVLRPIDLPYAPEQSSMRRVWGMLEDRAGALWIGTAGGLLRRTPDGRVARRPLQPGDRATEVRVMIEDPEGRLWVGHKDGLTIFVPDPADGPIDSHGVIQGVRFIGQATAPQAGRLTLPSAPGETRLFTPKDGLGRGLPTSLLRASDGRIWLTTIEGELTVFDGTAFSTFTSTAGIAPRASALAEDHEGNLWVGSQVEGVSRLARDGFTSYGPADGLQVGPRPSIVDSPVGDVVFLSGRNLWVFDGRRFSPVRIDLPVLEKPPVLRDRRGEWWIGTSKGLYRFAAVRRTQDLASARPRAVYGIADGLPADGVGSLCEDGRGDIWVATGAGDALARWERATGRIQTFMEPSGTAVAGSIQSCATDRSGAVWLALSGRLVRFESGGFTRFTEDDGVPGAGVTALIIDRRGRLWVTYFLMKGLLRCDDPTAEHPRFNRYTTHQGLTNVFIKAIAEDPFGRIYLGTAAGVDRLDPDTGYVHNYSTADGLSNDEVDDIFLDAKGVLWFTGLQGVSSLKPRSDTPDIPAPSVRITSLRAGGIERSIPALGRTSLEGIELHQARSQLEIVFGGISFGLGGKLRFQYRLEGVDEDWSAPSGQRSVNYASLSPGRYRFQVRAMTAEGTVSPRPAVISFTVLPPVWRRWWFLSIAGLAIAGAVYAAHRARIARVLAVERVRTRLAMDLHDDVGASLSQIAVLSEVAQQEALGPDPDLTGPLSRIADVSRGMVDALSDIVWATNPARDRVVDLVARMRRFATDLLTARGIELHFTGRESEGSLRLEPEVRRQVFLVFKEAVNNAARHSRCKRVEIGLEVKRNAIILRVSDDGIGFEPDRAGAGHGLSSMSRRAAALDGLLKTVSTVGEGTTLTLVLPLKRPRSGRRAP